MPHKANAAREGLALSHVGGFRGRLEVLIADGVQRPVGVMIRMAQANQAYDQIALGAQTIDLH
jgi:hypothetical protein